MARTRKSVQPLNLLKYDVLINDSGPRSNYFLISQFDGYFYGGRNAFLIAGTTVLKPNTEILVEILDVDGNTVYSAPVSQFIEGNSRLVKIEVYSDTPIGPGKLVILGCADSYIDGTPVPQDWVGKYNIRWVSDVIISPLIENKTPLRFFTDPKIEVTEKFYNAPSSSIYQENVTLPVNVQFSPKYFSIFQNGYLMELSGSSANDQFYSYYNNGILTGSIRLITPSGVETASINLPITKIFNKSVAETTGSLITTTKNNIILDGFISGSGSYVSDISPLGTVGVTSSLNVQYSRLQTENTGSVISFAKIRLVDLNTISGEIHKVRVSYKPSTEPGEFVVLGDVNTNVQELLATDSGSKIVQTGKFPDVIIDDYWYAATMSLAKNEIEPTLPTYYTSSSLYTNLNLQQQSSVLLDAITADVVISNGTYEDNRSYFIGTTNSNSILLFPRSEYTLSFQAFVTKTSGSVQLSQSDYSLEVYLVPQESSDGKLLDLNARGQLLGTLTPSATFSKQNFETVNFNFIPKINFSGNFGIRFVAYGGFWNVANVSVKVAQEPFFSPDEVDIIIPNVNYYNKFLTFKTEYLDVNNNSIGIATLSNPVYFTGSASQTGTTSISGSSVSSSYAITASYAGTSSWASSSVSSSYATTASLLLGSVVSSSYALTSSHALSGPSSLTIYEGAMQELFAVNTSGTQATVTFSGIPTTYKSLLITVNGRGTNASDDVGVYVQVNGDSTTNYEYIRENRFGTTGTLTATYMELCNIPGANIPTNQYSVANIWLHDYSNSTKMKQFYGLSNLRGNGTIFSQEAGGFWKSTSAAVSSITMSLSAGNWENGSVVTLYGIGGTPSAINYSGSLNLSGSFTASAISSPSITGSLLGTASYAVSALTSSFAISSSIAQTASYFEGFINFPSGLDITGSLVVSGSMVHTGSIKVTSGGITGSLFGTSSQAISASWAPNTTKTIATFTPLDNQPPATNFATLDTRNSIALLDFDAASNEVAVFVGVIPEGAIFSSGIQVRLGWAATSATSGACVWEAAVEKSTGGDIDTDSFSTAVTASTTTSGTSGVINTTAITLTAIDSVTAGDTFRLRVARSGSAAADTMTDDAELMTVEMRTI